MFSIIQTADQFFLRISAIKGIVLKTVHMIVSPNSLKQSNHSYDMTLEPIAL